MKTLILFSLKRRFKNRVSIGLSILYVLIVTAIMYADVISEFFNFDFSQPYEIVLDNVMQEKIVNNDLWLKQGFVFSQENGNLSIEYIDDVYVVKGKTDLILQTKIKELLLNNHQHTLLSTASSSAQEYIDNYSNINLVFDQETFGIDYLKQQIIMVLLTSLYFMMLNFIAVNSNEIILEKTSNVLALFLSCVSSFEHYLAKFISGIVNVSVQILGSILVIATLIFIRYQDDRGQGLFIMISKYLPIPLEDLNFNSFFSLFNFQVKDFFVFLLSLIFLVIGIAIVQVLVLVLSSRVKTSEEAGAIQGPFYLALLILYYGSLSLNSSEQLSNGLGYILSFVPVTSMLVMPMRIVSNTVPFFELLLSSLISLISLAFILTVLYPIYKKGLSRV